MSRNDFYLVLPNIRSCHNVGAMFRTADCFGVTKLFLAGYTAAPPKPQIDKVSLGAEKWIPWERIEISHFKFLIFELKKKGFQIAALEKTCDGIPLESFKPRAPIALIVGNEVDGINLEILALCDTIVHIPMYGKKESLNVSIAAGIAMHHIKQELIRSKK